MKLKTFIASLIPVMLTILGSYLAINNLWWFVIIFTIVSQNGWTFFFSGGTSFKKAISLTDAWHIVQALTSLICTIFMIVFMFIVASPWWGILIMVFANLVLPFLLPSVSVVASTLCSIVPALLFNE